MPVFECCANDHEPVKTHGYTGYQKGCRCFTCRRGKADAIARYRARKKEEETGSTAYTADAPDTMAILAKTEIMGLGTLSDEAESIAHMAIVTAQLIDKIRAENTWHLLNATTKRYTELMRDLRAATGLKNREEGEDDGDDFLGTMGQLGNPRA